MSSNAASLRVYYCNLLLVKHADLEPGGVLFVVAPRLAFELAGGQVLLV